MNKKRIFISVCALALVTIFFTGTTRAENPAQVMNVQAIINSADLVKAAEIFAGNNPPEKPTSIIFDSKDLITVAQHIKKIQPQISNFMKQSAFIITGIGATALSLYIAGLLAHKHVNSGNEHIPMSKSDGAAACASVTQ
jgi:hypothetical protein